MGTRLVVFFFFSKTDERAGASAGASAERSRSINPPQFLFSYARTRRSPKPKRGSVNRPDYEWTAY